MNGKVGKIAVCERVSKIERFSFADNTTYGCGGLAKCAYFPKSTRQATAVYDFLKKNDIKSTVLGNGSNVLASDKFFDGAVICTKKLTGIYRTGANTLFCRSGTLVSALLKFCASNGFGGLEYLAGIPATLGGVLYMNGGACGKFIQHNAVYVKVYDGKMSKLSNKSCKFGQKYSIMQEMNALILGAELSFVPESQDEIRRKIALNLEKRKSQPKGRSCGCVFKNPENESAGKLIDQAGLKGFRIGGASVSAEHANFIINSGYSSADVYAVIQEVKRRVFERTGVRLEEEVVYIGEFNDTFG